MPDVTISKAGRTKIANLSPGEAQLLASALRYYAPIIEELYPQHAGFPKRLTDAMAQARVATAAPPAPAIRLVPPSGKAGGDPLLNVEEAAERLSTTVGHVRKLIREGRLAHVRVGRFMRVRESAVASFINEAV